MAQIAPPAQVKGIGKFARVLLVEVLLVALTRPLGLHLMVRHLHGILRTREFDCTALFALLGAGNSGDGVGVEVNKLLGSLGHAVRGVMGLLEGLLQRREVPRLLEALNGRLATAGEHNVPGRKGTDDDGNDATANGEHDKVDGHKRLHVLSVGEDLVPDPSTTNSKAVETEEGSIDEEEQEGLVVAQANAGGEPGAMVVHLEDAPTAGRAVVGAVGLAGLAFLAVAKLAVALDGEGCGMIRTGL